MPDVKRQLDLDLFRNVLGAQGRPFGIGALLAFLAFPFGRVPVGALTGVCALAGGAVGSTADAMTEDRRETAASESSFTLKAGQSDVVAEISKDRVAVPDDAMRSPGGTGRHGGDERGVWSALL